jgi:GNAT superfamily N-acetyltransferase
MAEVQVRPAQLADFAAVAGLLGELGRPAVTPEAEADALAVYRRHIDRWPATASLVAEEDGEVAGFMSLEFRERLNRIRPQAWIPDLIVTERFRGRHAGKALLCRGLELARERGCWSVILESGRSRVVAHALYRAVGMENEGEYFILRL